MYKYLGSFRNVFFPLPLFTINLIVCSLLVMTIAICYLFIVTNSKESNDSRNSYQLVFIVSLLHLHFHVFVYLFRKWLTQKEWRKKKQQPNRKFALSFCCVCIEICHLSDARKSIEQTVWVLERESNKTEVKAKKRETFKWGSINEDMANIVAFGVQMHSNAFESFEMLR